MTSPEHYFHILKHLLYTRSINYLKRFSIDKCSLLSCTAASKPAYSSPVKGHENLLVVCFFTRFILLSGK